MSCSRCGAPARPPVAWRPGAAGGPARRSGGSAVAQASSAESVLLPFSLLQVLLILSPHSSVLCPPLFVLVCKLSSPSRPHSSAFRKFRIYEFPICDCELPTANCDLGLGPREVGQVDKARGSTSSSAFNGFVATGRERFSSPRRTPSINSRIVGEVGVEGAPRPSGSGTRGDTVVHDDGRQWPT